MTNGLHLRRHVFGAGTAITSLIGLLSASVAVAQHSPTNTDCLNATWISDGAIKGTNAGVNTLSNAVGGSVWYAYTAAIDGTLTVSTCGSSLDTQVSIWDGCPADGGSEIAWNDDDCGLQSTVIAPVRAGSEYLIQVGTHAGVEGDFLMNVAAAVNEDFGGIALAGPDVVLTDVGSTSNYGAIGNIRAYALGSNTCNIGNQNLIWASSGTPGYAMNMFRLYNGRLEQIGLSFVKTACCAAAGSGCGVACNGQGGSVLGAGCLDVYTSGWNGGQSRLAARSAINAWTGAFSSFSSASGDAIFKRLQVVQNDVNTTLFPNALYFVEGVYVGSDDAASGNRNNNASHKRVTMSPTTFDISLVGAIQRYIPAIQAWRDNGLGVGVPDPSITIASLDVPSEGRFWYGYRVRDLGNGQWRYDYAIYNLSSDRSGGSVSIPRPAGVNITNVGFRDCFYHSGEPYDNTDWSNTVSAGSVTWNSPQTFAQNANSNALRWGTMYNFWFDADRPPTAGSGTLGLFKPHTPQSVTFAASVPSAPPTALPGDANCDGVVNNFDIDAFVMAVSDPSLFATTYVGCNIMNSDTNNDGVVDNFDIDSFVALLT